MGNREMPTVADFLKIEPLTSELVLEIGYLPQCSRSCGNETRWVIEADYYCTAHKDEIAQQWEAMITDWVDRPAQAQDSDLELLELIRDELKSPKFGEIYPGLVLGQIVKELSLPDTPEGRSLASWYLWEMEIFNISQRVMFFEGATN